MGRKPLSKESETTRFEVRIPTALKSAAESKLRGKETLSEVVRAAIEAFVTSRSRPKKLIDKQTPRA